MTRPAARPDARRVRPFALSSLHPSRVAVSSSLAGSPRALTPRSATRAPESAPVTRWPRLCIVGALLGRHAGYVVTQGEILRDHFEASGFEVIAFSDQRNRYRRLASIVGALIRHRAWPDVLLLQTYSGRSFVVEDIACALGRLFGHRVILHLHGGGMPAFMQAYPRWTRRVLARADAIVAPSSFLAHAVAEHGFRARVIPNVIDIADYRFRLRERLRPRLFWMRAFHPLYNPLLALRVLERVRRVRPDTTLVMGGQDGGYEADVRRAAERLGLHDAVRFTGYLDRDAKRREWDAADLYLNTNRVDNTPVSVLEACAMGVPVVATNVGGVRHLLEHEHSALLVPDDDDAAMADAVLRLLDDPALARRLAVNGRVVAERSAWPRVLDAWEELFAEWSPTLSHDRRETTTVPV